ncbi:hypothetical protein CH63R_06578 [Colletotrichum higginsianum IMI 349063]|uniref:Uncharacterized protein n=1 Tax=Colletotrichum higginsianum (strain IMI 349063) TaxID=759273 RepID=A0A1B7YFQ4_COLHI|nr:hypothetical protein CH63R_06578 [Colletotrichum higginsianum IMI 349063]OBR10886.1 hypothetical protein CH63R_06578 [Colletotrichum higginsianum IMI 349063]
MNRQDEFGERGLTGKIMFVHRDNPSCRSGPVLNAIIYVHPLVIMSWVLSPDGLIEVFMIARPPARGSFIDAKSVCILKEAPVFVDIYDSGTPPALQEAKARAMETSCADGEEAGTSSSNTTFNKKDLFFAKTVLKTFVVTVFLLNASGAASSPENKHGELSGQWDFFVFHQLILNQAGRLRLLLILLPVR